MYWAQGPASEDAGVSTADDAAAGLLAAANSAARAYATAGDASAKADASAGDVPACDAAAMLYTAARLSAAPDAAANASRDAAANAARATVRKFHEAMQKW